MNLFFQQKPLMITLEHTYLLLKFGNGQPEKILLDNAEIDGMIINNPSAIATHINNFLQKHRLKKANVIINVPWLKQAPAKLKPFITLQITLCIASSQGRLQEIISEPDHYNYLNLFKKKSTTSPYLWLGSTFIIGLIGAGILIKSHRSLSQEEHVHKATINNLKTSTQQLESQATAIKQLQQEKQTLEAQASNVNQATSYATTNVQLLKAISEAIPEDTVITKLLIEKQQLTITGISKNLNSVPLFLSSLRKQDAYKEVKITSMQQTTAQNDVPVYVFSFEGLILYPV